MENPKIMIFTDGGCSGNPGPGGWAYIIVSELSGVMKEQWGAEQNTTNNRMELTAAVKALEALLTHESLRAGHLTMYTDSQYVQKGITSWIQGWKRNGWKTSGKEPVKNQDLWQKLDQLAAAFHIEWRWVKGHAGNTYNERVDQLTQDAIASLKKG